MGDVEMLATAAGDDAHSHLAMQRPQDFLYAVDQAWFGSQELGVHPVSLGP
jgi:hypothetical protein